MAEVIGVKFKEAGKIYYFDPAGHQIKKGQKVVVETARGIECGDCAMENKEVADNVIVKPLKSIVRPANAQDLRVLENNKEKEARAFRICEEKIAQFKLDMHLVEVEYTFDGSKVLFFYTAPQRVDFRELVKCLAGIFRIRIELRQICLHQNGQGAGPFAEPRQDQRHLRTADVLPEI